jgi:hypothetical protein
MLRRFVDHLDQVRGPARLGALVQVGKYRSLLTLRELVGKVLDDFGSVL